MAEVENIIDVKNLNIKKILYYLNDGQITTKKQAAQDLNLSFATVSSVCNRLEADAYIASVASGEEKPVGRSPKMIMLNPNRMLSVCVNLTQKDVVSFSVLNFAFETLFTLQVKLLQDATIGDVIATCQQTYENNILTQFKADSIVGIGIAVPGIYDKTTTHIVGSEIELFENQPIKSMVIESLKKPVYIENESSLCAAAIGLNNNKPSNERNIIYLYVSEGLGIGVVTGGLLLQGAYGHAPEICHLPIGNEQLQCNLCKNHGCVQSDLSCSGFVKKYNILAENHINDFDEFIDLVHRKNQHALTVIEENSVIFGRLCSLLVNLFNPDKIIVGGAGVSAMRFMQNTAKAEISKRLVVKTDAPPQFAFDESADATMMVGAAEMVYANWTPSI